MSVKRYTLATPRGEHMAGWWSIKIGMVTSQSGEYVLATDFDALSKRLEEAERDAARYRWLRRDDITSQAGVYSDDDCNTWLTMEKLDAIVDAEMEAHRKANGE